MSNIFLWLQLLKKIKVTGAVAFSSDKLIKRMLTNIDFSEAKVIVELGAGSGCITEWIARKIEPHSILIVFEIDEVFCKKLRNKFAAPNIHIINDSAENMEQYLKKITGKAEADFVISSLPFSIINEDVRERIIHSIQHVLMPQSLYVQYGYNKKKYQEILNEFYTIKTSFVLGNFPPAYVFNCKLWK
ncbi:MAG: methyltransferase domain-containing protein [Bacteroidetes bacterium]|nr:methyltransferase domain-containing protein [Bacteroidota bacterium]